MGRLKAASVSRIMIVQTGGQEDSVGFPEPYFVKCIHLLCKEVGD